MSGLPQGWVLAAIREFCQKIVDGSHNPPKGGGAGYPMISARNIQARKIDFNECRYLSEGDFNAENRRTKVRPQDVLLTIVGTIGRVAVVQQDSQPFALQRSIAVLNSSIADGRYLSFVLEAPTTQKLLTENAKGTAQKGIYLKALASIELPLAPLPEQTRIADKLDALLARVDAIRARLDTIPALLKRFRQSVLAAATSGALTEEWRGGGEAEWEDATIGDVCESSFYGPRFGKDEYTRSENGIPTVRTTDMTDDGRIEITDDTPRVAVPADKIEKFAAKAGDLLVTRTGSIGVMAVFDGSFVAIPSAYLIRFRFKETVLPRYAFYCLMAPAGQSAMGLSTTAITQPNINAESIKAISISLPPIDEQAEIVRRVESLFAIADRVQAQYTTARARVDRLTPALLAKAFRGELVPQDPSDEPASALLQRLRAGKASAAAPAKRGRKPSTAAAKARKPR